MGGGGDDKGDCGGTSEEEMKQSRDIGFEDVVEVPAELRARVF